MSVPTIKEIELADFAPGKMVRTWLHLIGDALGNPVTIPILVARGQEEGPVLGVTAALHGNELNGIAVIQRLFAGLNPAGLRGTVIGAPVLNTPAFFRQQRVYPDGRDLNHVMPGEPAGNASQVYAHRLFSRLVSRFDILIDLHTASFGRINSHYVRADMAAPLVAELARLQQAEIILHNQGGENTLRRQAMARGIPALTIELRDPQVIQPGVVEAAVSGIRNALVHLQMVSGKIQVAHRPAVECSRSYWIYTDRGGLLDVPPNLTETISAGQLIGRLRDVFGDLIREYTAPEAGIVIGKSTNPVNETGGRILHLGIPDVVE